MVNIDPNTAARQPISGNILTINALDNMKEIEGVRFDTDLAAILGVEKTMPGKWRQRGSVPLEHILGYAQRTGVSLEYLLLDRGPIKIADVIAEPAPAYGAAIQFDLYLQIAQTIDSLFKEADVQVGREVSQEKRDHLIAYCYNQHIKDGIDHVEKDRVAESVRLVI